MEKIIKIITHNKLTIFTRLSNKPYKYKATIIYNLYYIL